MSYAALAAVLIPKTKDQHELLYRAANAGAAVVLRNNRYVVAFHGVGYCSVQNRDMVFHILNSALCAV